MTKLLTTAILATLTLFGQEITLSHAAYKSYGQSIKANAKIMQLSSQQQRIVSILGGHIEKYFVQAGQKVRTGDKVALIQSLELSQMTSEYLSLKQQIKAAAYDLESARKLYRKGVGSKQEYNDKLIRLQEIKSKKNTLRSQLNALGIDVDTLKSPSDALILHAHADGVVGELLVPLHSTVDAQTPLMTLVKESGYHALAYLSPKESLSLNEGVKGWVKLPGRSLPCTFVQLLPEVDSETQRAQVLFKIEEDPRKLLLGAFIPIEIILPPYQKAIMVKKSALTLFGGEWVVFVPNEAMHEEPEAHKNDHSSDEGHEEKRHAEEEEGHEEHEEHEAAPYLPKVVEIIGHNGDEVAVKGLEKNEAYVSDGIYFVKSLLLKSSLGEHGH